MAILLVVCLVLTISGSAMAQVVPLSDPNECPYCGYGSIIAKTEWSGNLVDDPTRENVDCLHGSPVMHKDIYLREAGVYTRCCDVCQKGPEARIVYRYWVLCTYTGETYPA